jgi:crotonobetaine/carnitine-CoA ligase
MLGYFRDEEETAKALRGGLLHTGDAARADENGYLYFLDRKKDMIKRAGENVAAQEVEAILLQFPGVSAAAVFGIPDPIRDEMVVAALIPADAEALPDPEAIVAFCGERLAAFKVPSTIHFVEQFPATATGKVKKRDLREQFAPDSAAVR